MNQSILALAALLCITLLAYNVQKQGIERDRWSLRAEVEAQAATLGAKLLDAAASAPLLGGGTQGQALGRGLPLADWEGRRDTVNVPFDRGELQFVVLADVDTVQKHGQEFVVSPLPSPYYRLRLDIEGPLDTRAQMERVYTRSHR